MRYIDVRWIHQDPAEPVRLVSEIGEDGFETRKLEFRRNGVVTFASATAHNGDTRLGTAEIPSLEEVNESDEFDGIEIDQGEFELLWLRHAQQR